ncbi:MAG: HD-GYP domain-containing protein [Nitrospira sp.]|nr:HD-GYP domain-containing protein [Nitrospira sp.]
MKKWIDIDKLQPGMRIEKIDRSWLSTPFFRHRSAGISAERIEQLKACGVRSVEVVIEDQTVQVEPVVEEKIESEPDHGTDDSIPSTKADGTPPVPFEEELPAARQVYKAAKTVIHGAMQDVRLGRAVNMDAVNQVVSDMTESVFRNPDALASLSRLKRFDEYTFYHSVNTSLLAMSLGRELGFDQGALHQIGVGTLLHDIGKVKIPVEILNKPGRFEAHEMEIMKQHVMRGVEVLSGTTGLTEIYWKPAMEHHERVDGSGYPFHRMKDDLSQFGLIAAVVDIYDAITSDRCYHKGRPAHDALQYLYLISLKGHLDPDLVQRFIRVVGVFPVGSVVELNTGEVAVVRRVCREAPLEPLIVIVKSAGNMLLSSPLECDLRQQAESSPRAIASVQDPHSSGINPSVYLDKEPL